MTTQFLADENVPGSVVNALRSVGRDVGWVLETAPGLPDRDVIALAGQQGRVLLSFDKDFGKLAQSAPPSPGFGTILIRVRMPATVEAGRTVADTIASRADWAGHVSVIEPGRVRMRAIPGAS